jgi:CheY-like chemotaxis protein
MNMGILKNEGTILVVDDAPMNQQLIERILMKHVGRIIFANNGAEAVQIFMNEPVALILMDMEMPVMDGYTASRYIRSLKNGKDVPIIALTGHTGDNEKDKCVQAGCSGFIQKPIQKVELLETTQKYLSTLQKQSMMLS